MDDLEHILNIRYQAKVSNLISDRIVSISSSVKQEKPFIFSGFIDEVINMIVVHTLSLRSVIVMSIILIAGCMIGLQANSIVDYVLGAYDLSIEDLTVLMVVEDRFVAGEFLSGEI